MFEIKNVSKKYGKLLAIDDISFNVEAGSISVLIGPNGAGKSTIIKSIVGLLRYKGSISIAGYDNRSIDAKRVLGYVPELPSIYEGLTVGEHLTFIEKAYKVKDDVYKAHLLSIFELDDKLNKLGSELSKGMQQKLSIICALLHKPKAIIFDEPMIGLDPHSIKMLIETIKELANDGAAIIISTHLLSSVEEYWENAHIMKDGKILASLSNDGEVDLESLFFKLTESDREKASSEKILEYNSEQNKNKDMSSNSDDSLDKCSENSDKEGK